MRFECYSINGDWIEQSSEQEVHRKTKRGVVAGGCLGATKILWESKWHKHSLFLFHSRRNFENKERNYVHVFLKVML
jgi:hypothetical protein